MQDAGGNERRASRILVRWAQVSDRAHPAGEATPELQRRAQQAEELLRVEYTDAERAKPCGQGFVVEVFALHRRAVVGRCPRRVPPEGCSPWTEAWGKPTMPECIISYRGRWQTCPSHSPSRLHSTTIRISSMAWPRGKVFGTTKTPGMRRPASTLA